MTLPHPWPVNSEHLGMCSPVARAVPGTPGPPGMGHQVASGVGSGYSGSVLGGRRCRAPCFPSSSVATCQQAGRTIWPKSSAPLIDPLMVGEVCNVTEVFPTVIAMIGFHFSESVFILSKR